VPQSEAAKPTILVVDDSRVNVQVLVGTLDGTGHRILVAMNGKSALEIAHRVHPDLILLDVMMPEMDGFEVCRQLKADPTTRNIDVIFLSASGDLGDKVAGLELGASDYITKPIQAEEVLARVANHLLRLRLEREVRESRDSLDRELAVAAEMQKLILPQDLKPIGDLRFAAHYQTSRYVGGDYYDIVRLPDNRCGILVVDVSGHGATSAIVMAMIRATFHAYGTPPLDPAKILRYLNEQFRFLWGRSLLATALYAVIDTSNLTMSVACAGHPPPLIIRDGSVQELNCATSIPLLMMDVPEISCSRHEMKSGDRILFYTDGITERENAQSGMYDISGLTEVLRKSSSRPSDDMLRDIVQDVERFADGREAHDDQTLLLVSVG
jgi:sigma-B regulation protein RsbU (phosphoserine phosphatase)